ncbi:hypothetical protein [Pedobacter sp. ASV28]|uniref:hypothetical protein n=1 Tax=Pedobacter sp. ASV28 TaxID=2795123 RepID=UPI0018ED2264|nr:hypothetical protein [Pedobacter sp. ASV28]
MNGANKIELFITAAIKDCRLNKGHLALYMALFHFWSQSDGHNPMSLFCQQVMPVAKISSNATYHRLIRELDEFGYIKYSPSFYKAKASLIYL